MDIFTLHGFTGSIQNWSGVVDGIHLPIMGHAPDVYHLHKKSFRAEVDRLKNQLREECHLIGYSLGARLALAIAIEYPKMVRRLTLVGVNPGLSDFDEREKRVIDDQRWIDCLRLQGIASFVNDWESIPLWNSQKKVPNKTLEHQRCLRLKHNPEQLALALESLGLGVMPNYQDQLAEIKADVHLVTGSLDTKFSKIAASMASSIGNARHSLVEDCGHNPLLESPKKLTQLIREGFQ